MGKKIRKNIKKKRLQVTSKKDYTFPKEKTWYLKAKALISTGIASNEKIMNKIMKIFEKNKVTNREGINLLIQREPKNISKILNEIKRTNNIMRDKNRENLYSPKPKKIMIKKDMPLKDFNKKSWV